MTHTFIHNKKQNEKRKMQKRNAYEGREDEDGDEDLQL